MDIQTFLSFGCSPMRSVAKSHVLTQFIFSQQMSQQMRFWYVVYVSNKDSNKPMHRHNLLKVCWQDAALYKLCKRKNNLSAELDSEHHKDSFHKQLRNAVPHW